jgi:N-acyl-D-amino-acid deacylase
VTRRTLLRGGIVADGIGSTTQRADVLIEGPMITAVEVIDPVPAECDVLEVGSGGVICPGFIDSHVHAEGPLLDHGRVDGALAQGITTLVVGQDGSSWIGASAATVRYLNSYFAAVNGALEPAHDLSLSAHREAVSGRLSQNIAVLASQGTIRHNVVGMSPAPLDPGERKAARAEVEAALSDGAVGLSSGLDYLPSRFGGVDEVAYISQPLAGADRPYVSHLRAYGPGVRAGLAELVAVGHAAGTRVHASHLWGRPAEIEAAFKAADTLGVQVTFDMYPYRRSSTILAMMLLPSDMQTGGPQQTLRLLGDPSMRAALLADEKFSDQALSAIVLGSLPPHLSQYAGRTLTEAAGESSQPAGEWVLDLLISADLNIGAHLDRPSLSDDDLAWTAENRRHCAGSDGIYQGQHPHPRGYGAFALLAKQYLAGDPPRAYQQLVRHLSTNAADAYGLRNRGRIAPGAAADVCVIDPGHLASNATYESPTARSAGVLLVFVNGVVTWRQGQPVAQESPGEVVN